MKSTVLASGLLALAASTATAQYTIQSKPFYLELLSDNTTINGNTISPCHEGAAIEGLCVGGPLTSTSQLYTFNSTTSTGLEYNATLGEPGYLTYTLDSSAFNESEPMMLYYNPTTNVALTLFQPVESDEDAIAVAFDVDGKMNIQGYESDTTLPVTEGIQAYYRWWVCETYFEGYTYEALVWVMGVYEPEIPNCVKVDVTRVSP